MFGTLLARTSRELYRTVPVLQSHRRVRSCTSCPYIFWLRMHTLLSPATGCSRCHVAAVAGARGGAAADSGVPGAGACGGALGAVPRPAGAGAGGAAEGPATTPPGAACGAFSILFRTTDIKVTDEQLVLLLVLAGLHMRHCHDHWRCTRCVSELWLEHEREDSMSCRRCCWCW